MMRTVLLLVAVLGGTLAQVRTADACGVKLAVKAPKVGGGVERSANPSKLLLISSSDSKRLASNLDKAGHDVDTASSVEGAPRGDYQAVIVDADMKAEASSKYPGAKIVVRAGSSKESLASVESSLGRTSTDRMARRPTDRTARPTDFGPRAAGRTPTAFGPAAPAATETQAEGAAEGDTPTPAPEPAATPAPEPKAVAVAKPERKNQDVAVTPRSERTGRKATAAVEGRAAAPAEEPVPAKHAGGGRLVKSGSFGGGSDELSSAFRSRLDASARWLAANPDVSIVVEGHASQVGAADMNQTLSESRASAVKDYLVSQGVDGSRIETVGFGFERPAFEPASSPRNRRVAIRVK